MTRLGWTGSLFMTLGLALGLAIGWGLARQVAGLPGQLLRVGQVPSYKPVEIVPDSVNWPEGEPVRVATVEPPTRKEARKLEQDFGFRLNRTRLLSKFDLPPIPDGGSGVVLSTEGDEPRPVRVVVKANSPPLIRVRWEPEVSAWYGFGSGGEGIDPGKSWATYVSLPRLLCIRDRVCLQARGGYEVRPWGDGAVAEVGASVRF